MSYQSNSLVLAGRIISVKQFRDNVSCYFNVVAVGDRQVKETVTDLRMKPSQYEELQKQGFGQHAKITLLAAGIIAWQEKDANGNPCDKALPPRKDPVTQQPIEGTERRVHRLKNPNINGIRVVTSVAELVFEDETDEKKLSMNASLAAIAGETAFALQEEAEAAEAERALFMEVKV